LRAVAAGLLLERLWVYGSSYLRADGHLRRYAIVELAQASLSLILTVGLALWWGLLGAYVGFLIGLALSVLLLVRSVPFQPEIATRSIRRLLSVGVPLSVAAVAATLLTTVDRLIVAGLEGTEALGFYAFAVAASGLGASAALAVRTVVFPDVYAHARREGGEEAAETHLRDTVLPVAHLLPPLLGLVALALGPVVALIAPRYVEVLPVARIFIFTGVASGIMDLGTLGLIAAERQRLLPLVTFGGLAFNAVAGVGALLGGLGLAGVAAGALVSRSLTGVAIVAVTSSGPGVGPATRLLGPLLWPLAWCAGVVALICWLRPGIGVAATALSTLLYLVALAPLFPKLAQGLGRLNRDGSVG
jgi:O-antigen/teichoic acid export membrane protein